MKAHCVILTEPGHVKRISAVCHPECNEGSRPDTQDSSLTLRMTNKQFYITLKNNLYSCQSIIPHGQSKLVYSHISYDYTKLTIPSRFPVIPQISCFIGSGSCLRKSTQVIPLRNTGSFGSSGASDNNTGITGQP